MRTRFYDSLRNREIEEYLGRSDVIFLPVGTIEMHGEMPVGCEHVLPLAMALKMAEQVDGLVLPNLPYFYAGATQIGRGTLQIPPSAGSAYLKTICRSLLRQGFRRQVLLSTHGPACTTVAPLVREFIDETKCLILYIDFEPYWGPDHPLSDAERGARAREGVALIDRILRTVDPPALVEKMKELDLYLQEQVLPKYRDHLP